MVIMMNVKKIYKFFGLLFAAIFMLTLCACTSSGDSQEASRQTSQTLSSSNAQSKSTENEENSSEAAADEPKVLVAYFSATGNTKQIAENIAEITGGDLFEIVPSEPYTDEDLNYNDSDCRANQEQNDSTARPEISSSVENIQQYDIVLIGHPIWWGEEPRIIDTFIESYDFSGKTVANFCTSGGSGISSATENLKALAPGADWRDGRRFETGADGDAVREWLKEINILN